MGVSLATVRDCWNSIGVNGDGSCPELRKVTHCRNCPVYSAGGQSLLEREPPAGYVQEWTDLLAAAKAPQRLEKATSVLVFQIALETLALPTAVVQEVAEHRRPHRIPHAKSKALAGVVSIRGELHLCCSMRELLGITDDHVSTAAELSHRQLQRRSVLIGRAGEPWVFEADAVLGVHRYHDVELSAPPSTAQRGGGAHALGTFEWEGRAVGLLDADRVFAALKGAVQ